jgi:hypothetical protein
MGKYAKLRGQFVRFTEEPDYQSRLNAHRDSKVIRRVDITFSELTLSQPLGKQSMKVLGKILAAIKDKKKKIEEATSEINAQIAAIQQVLLESLEGEELESFRSEEGLFSIKDEPYPFIEKEKQAEFYQWIKDQKLESLFTVNYNTMAAMVREMLLTGKPLPPGIGVYMKAAVNFTPTREKSGE